MALRVSGPFHSALMAPAAEAFRADLEAVSFQPATVPVYQNVTAAPTQDPTALRDQLLVQLSAPVQWTRSVQAMGAAGSNGHSGMWPWGSAGHHGAPHR